MRRRSQGIEPENYVPAPEPPAPVENLGIGRQYLTPQQIPLIWTSGCTGCGALVFDTNLHEAWHLRN